MSWSVPSYRWDREGVWIAAQDSRIDLTSAFPLPLQGTIPVPRWLRLLDSLHADEVLEIRPEGARMPYSALYGLEDGDRRDLRLPSILDSVSVRLEDVGTYVGAPDFGLRAVLTTPAGELVPDAGRSGAVIHTTKGLRLVPKPVWDLLEHLDRGVPGGATAALLHLAELKRLADKAGAQVSPYIESEDVVAVDSMGIEVEVLGPDAIEIRPSAPGHEEFDSLVQAGSQVVQTYTLRTGDRKRRLVLGPEQRSAVAGVKSRSRLTGPEVPAFFDNPEAFLPDEVDLSRFSPRVKGLIPRRYQSQPYLQVDRGSRRDWFTVSPKIALTSEDGSPGTISSLAPDSAVEASPPPDVSPERYREYCQEVVDSGHRHVRHGDDWISIDPMQAKRFLEAWNEIEKGEDGSYRVPRDRVGLILDVISNVEDLEYSEDVPRSVVADPPQYPLPMSLQAELYPHQDLGYRWLRYLAEKGYGGLLADDMGLGKTVQVIALLAALAESEQLKPSLIVLPNALVANWQDEFERFSPGIRGIHVHQGSNRVRDPRFLASWDVVLTTYGTLRRDQLVLGEVDWKIVACDEAQNVKNPTAQVTSAIKGMKADFRVALTGTPVENGLTELWCIVDFIQPGRLGSRDEFRDQFERPILDAGSDEAIHTSSRRLHARLDPHYLRRIKEDVLTGLPTKGERRYSIDFGERQAAVYSRIVADLRAGRSIPLEAIQRLIQVASHPELVERTGAPLDQLVSECPKLAAVGTILEEIRSLGERAVIFTRYREMQKILGDLLAERFQLNAPVINGEVQGPQRVAEVKRFNAGTGFAVLILSPEAAGVGLNITGANHVIHYTRLWNPAREMQATDRVHRLGQTRDVTVHYPIVVGDGFRSVEEHLDDLLAEKAELARNVVWPRERLSVEAELMGRLEATP